MTTKVSRIELIDTLRGMAILGMVFYHLLFDLQWFLGLDIRMDSTATTLFARLVLSMFVFLVGVSLWLKYHRLTSCKLLDVYRSFRPKLTQLLLAALIITLATYFVDKNWTVYFGVIHFILVSTLITIPLLKIGSTYLWLMSFFAVIGGFLIKGLFPMEFNSFDFVPLLPWIGFVWFGVVVGRYISSNTIHPWVKFFLDRKYDVRLAWIGRRSLYIYLLHQPILIGILYIVSQVIS